MRPPPPCHNAYTHLVLSHRKYLRSSHAQGVVLSSDRCTWQNFPHHTFVAGSPVSSRSHSRAVDVHTRYGFHSTFNGNDYEHHLSIGCIAASPTTIYLTKQGFHSLWMDIHARDWPYDLQVAIGTGILLGYLGSYLCKDLK